jgi:hypothetical protein
LPLRWRVFDVLVADRLDYEGRHEHQRHRSR